MIAPLPLPPRPRRRRLCLAVSLAALLLAPAGRADAPKPLGESLTGEARASYDGGKLLFEDRDYSGAATKYRAAYEASHDPRLLWNIAACEKEMRHYARAFALVDRFLSEGAALISPDFVAQARATQTALRGFFSLVRVHVAPEGALVLIDGDELGRAPFASAVPVDLGKHVLRIEKDGFAPYEARLEVAGQSAVAIEVALKPIESVALLAVRPSEEKDTVALDDKIVARGNWEGPVSPGRHRVKVTADGKRAYVAELELANGEHRSIEVTLEEDNKKAAVWPWLVGAGAVVLAGGSVGAYFLFKPSNTEGPPPSGQLGTVYVDRPRLGRR